MLHIAADANHEAFIRHAIRSQDTYEFHQALATKRYPSSSTPYYCCKDTKIKRLLAWMETQKDAYPLYSAPCALFFYSTEDRPNAVLEVQSLKEAFHEIGIFPKISPNPTSTDIFEHIRTQQARKVSAMIVVMMFHGDAGVVRVGDEVLPIRTVLQHMDSPILKGIPKVSETWSDSFKNLITFGKIYHKTYKSGGLWLSHK